MKTTKRLLALLLALTMLLPLAACDSGTPDETAPDTPAVTTEAPTEAVTLSLEEQLAADRQAYLDTVTYLDFILTGEEAPYYMGRWFDKDIDGTPTRSPSPTVPTSTSWWRTQPPLT